MSKVLFEISEDNLETGMRGYPVGYCPTSYVDAQKGLFYCDYPISECASWSPQKVIHLLYHGKLGGEKEIEQFYQELIERAECHPEVIAHIEKLPRKGHPMKLLSAALLILGMYEKTGDYREDCLRVIAKLPHLVAACINHHAGWEKAAKPDLSKGYMTSFTEMVNIPGEKGKELEEAFQLFNILHYDHGGGNLSAFVGKAVASGLEDLFGSLSAAMCALAGPRHGSANQVTLEFVQLVLNEVGEKATEADVEALIKSRLEKKQLLFGFGHAVLRVEDPRATVQYDFVMKHYPDHPLVKIALLLRTAGPKVLLENPKITNPYPNVDAISGSLLTAAGFGYPEYFTVLFGLSRSLGIAIQAVYERLEAREGKGTPIIRPKYLYRPRLSQ
jgi:citrate synthase